MTPSILIETNPNFLFMFAVVNGRNIHQKDILPSREGTNRCSKHVNYSRLNSQRDWRGMYGHLIRRKKIFTSTMHELVIRAFKNMRNMATCMIWICQTSRTNHVFHKYQMRSGCKKKSIRITHDYRILT
jgi:hypothetical protein